MIRRLVRRLASAETLGLLLLLIALQVLTYGISSSLRNTDSRPFSSICLLSSLIALALSKHNLNAVHAAIVMIALGLLAVWILGAGLAGPLIDLGAGILAAVPHIPEALRSGVPIDTTAMKEAWLAIAGASAALSLRIQGWLLSLMEDALLDDGLVRSLIWVLVLWLISAWMGWFAGRRNAIAALLPSIMLLAAITSYSEYRIETLWLLVFVLLLLMGLWNYRNHTAQWEQRQVDYSDSIRYDVTQAVIFLSIVIGLVAFVTPSVSWRAIRDFLRERDRNEVADTLGVQPQVVPVRPVPAAKPILPRDHLLSGGFAQSPEIVMTIRTGELPPAAISDPSAEAPRYYWRSTTFDVYAGTGWVTSSGPHQKYDANTPLIPGLLSGYRSLHLDVQMRQPERKLHWSGVLFSTDVPITADWRVKPQTSLFANSSDLLQADLFAALIQNEVDTYHAQSYVPIVSIEELRAASTDYPEPIHERYLGIPASVPERVRRLASDITWGKTTAYDKVKAIESYLRLFPYDLEVPAPPPDREVADYFLFDLRRGYCDYYATAMVVLARANGLPARFVSGYAPGEYDAANAQYIVRELHAHSWAEVYFPGIGWVEFEPTASQPEITRPVSADELGAPQQPDETTTRLLYWFRLETAIYWLSPFALLLLAIVVYFTFVERALYLRLAPIEAVERIYRRLYRLGRPLAGERARAETVHEFMQKLLDKLHQLKLNIRRSRYLVQAEDDIRLLTHLYQATLFTRSTIEKKDARKALDAWKRLRWRLWVARMNIVARELWRARRPIAKISHYKQSRPRQAKLES